MRYNIAYNNQIGLVGYKVKGWRWPRPIMCLL